jgi:hypothetical protein
MRVVRDRAGVRASADPVHSTLAARRKSSGPRRRKIEAHLSAFPPITIAGHLVTLYAWLDDPDGIISCPTITWTWPNGTQSSHTADCDPATAAEQLHSDVQHGRLPAGEHHFRIAFGFEGREWAAERTVPVQ